MFESKVQRWNKKTSTILKYYSPDGSMNYWVKRATQWWACSIPGIIYRIPWIGRF